MSILKNRTHRHSYSRKEFPSRISIYIFKNRTQDILIQERKFLAEYPQIHTSMHTFTNEQSLVIYTSHAKMYIRIKERNFSL